MDLLFLISVTAICVMCYFLYIMNRSLDNIKRAECGFTGYRPPNTGKQFLDVIPLVDDMGNENTNLWVLDVGHHSGYRCISQWKLSKLMEDEKLYLILEPDRSISIKNSLDEKIGYYPSQDFYYKELQLRLEQGQLVIAAVRNWGLESFHAFYCGIAVYVYGEVMV